MQTRRIKELAAPLLDDPGAGRSNTRPSASGGQVAQLVEQRIENPRVGGSIPPLATIQIRTLRWPFSSRKSQCFHLVSKSKLRSTQLVDLFALVLLGGINHLARRGLEQGYQSKEEEVVGLRGRVELVASARRMLLIHGRALCTFDELSVDTLQNRILKATVRVLSAVPTVDRGLRKRLIDTYRSLDGIQDIRVSHSTFRSVQLHSNNRFYRFLLNVCELVSGAWLVDERSGSYVFRCRISPLGTG